MSKYEYIRDKLLHGHNPYAGFPVKDWAGTWYNDPNACSPIFRRALEMSKPTVAIEVGSFVGESSIHIAKTMRELNPGSVLICVDTWYGGFDHWTKVPEKLRFWFGRPSLYYQFIGNVMAHRVEDVILPLALDSVNAARLLDYLGIAAKFIYVDASHERGDALRDYETYWPLLESGGAMLIDDNSRFFPGVQHDWKEFTTAHGLTPIEDGEKGLIIKP